MVKDPIFPSPLDCTTNTGNATSHPGSLPTSGTACKQLVRDRFVHILRYIQELFTFLGVHLGEIS